MTARGGSVTFDKAQAELRDKGMWLEREFDAWCVYRRQYGVIHERKLVSTGVTWQLAYAAATGRSPF